MKSNERTREAKTSITTENAHMIITSQQKSTFLYENKNRTRLKGMTTGMRTSYVVLICYFTSIHPENTV